MLDESAEDLLNVNFLSHALLLRKLEPLLMPGSSVLLLSSACLHLSSVKDVIQLLEGRITDGSYRA